ncbi:MAG: site-specific integrase [Roseibium sp.]|uniref:site-specific integrase n=1 Tax=Roseibium sp. TaxID=1936156 RepID=UPI002602E966|nr:site-specific integrase [Roseibium sp.]MCV0427244.1 site-specific integrase [Roseibium sp.]
MAQPSAPPTDDDTAEAVDRRIEQLDTLAAVLPALAGNHRTEQLAHLLTNDDVETLRHLAREGMGENSLRALTSDLSYLEAWCLAAMGENLLWPAPEPLILKFIAHHLWDPEQRKKDSSHGMPEEVADALEDQGLLRTPKNTAGLRPPHAPATVQRRLASWSTLHRWRGLKGVFGSPGVRSALRLAVRVADRPRQPKSKKAVTADVLEMVLATCQGDDTIKQSLADLRDHALLLIGFSSGGRRRSEIAGLHLSQIAFENPVPADPEKPKSSLLACASIRLGRTKTEDSSGDDNHVVIIGRPVDALKKWLEAAKITEGSVFRAIDQWGNVKPRALTPQSINAVLKARIEKAGFDPKDFSAHGLRSGFLTEAANQGIPIQDAMQQSRHRSVAQASAYYNEASRNRRRSARILE